jgi:hypothetical protein
MAGNLTTASGGLTAAANVRQATLQATIVRADGTRVSLGTIAFYHKNPLRRLMWRVGRWLRGDFI